MPRKRSQSLPRILDTRYQSTGPISNFLSKYQTSRIATMLMRLPPTSSYISIVSFFVAGMLYFALLHQLDVFT